MRTLRFLAKLAGVATELALLTRRPGGRRGSAVLPARAPTQPTRVQLRSGFLKGRAADVIAEPGTPPHLWVVGTDFVVTVAGDLTRDQLISVAESLEIAG